VRGRTKRGSSDLRAPVRKKWTKSEVQSRPWGKLNSQKKRVSRDVHEYFGSVKKVGKEKT